MFVFRARSNAITGHVLTLLRIKKGLVNPREGAENPLHELTKRTPREAAHHGMTAAGLGARSGAENAALALVFLFFFFREPRFPENSEIQQFFKSPFHLQHISETSGKNACTRPAQVTSGYNKVRNGTRQTGLE